MSNKTHQTFEPLEHLQALLQANHASESELWVRIFKKGHRPTQRDARRLRGGLHCMGLDRRGAQRLTPRRACSNWSQKNVPHAEQLIEQGDFLFVAQCGRAVDDVNAAISTANEMPAPSAIKC